ncbi:MAG: ATP-binding protein [Nocardioides sp.]
MLYRDSGATGRRVEYVIAGCVAASRVGTLVQMAPALPTGLRVSSRPVLFALAWVVAGLVAVSVTAWCVMRRRPFGPAAAAVDTAIAAALLLVGGSVVPDSYLVGSWIGWFPAYAVSVAVGLGALHGIRLWAGCLMVIVICYGIYVLPTLNTTTTSTALGNSLTFVVFSITFKLAFGFTRQIARQADDAMAEVARLTKLDEEHRARLVFHDATTVMQLLADPQLPTQARRHVQGQAATEYQRMREYLNGETPSASNQPDRSRQRTLAEVAGAATAGFDDLSPVLNLDLATRVALSSAEAAALTGALTTVLHNVRRHAGATEVVIHADTDTAAASGRWTLTVHDNGCGFDPATTPRGFGLAEQVEGELARVGMTTRVASSPGLGTTVSVSNSARADVQ